MRDRLRRNGVSMIALDGLWKFRIDPQNEGITNHWERENFKDYIRIPGILQEQGFGEEVSRKTEWVEGLSDPLWYLREEYQYENEDKVRIPFLSQPPKVYRGMAWYQTIIKQEDITEGKWYSLYLENTRWRSHVWCNDTYLGEDFSLCTPHEFSIGFLKKKEHKLTICLDNSMQLPYRPDGHGVSDALSAGWNGMVGRVELHSHVAVAIKEVRVFTDIDKKRATFEVTIQNHTKETVKASITIGSDNERELPISTYDMNPELTVMCQEGVTLVTLTKNYDHDTKLWDEFCTNLLKETISLGSVYGMETKEVTFGFIQAKSENGLFLVNHRPTYFRGTHFGGDYPLTGYPDCSLNFWQRIMKVIKEWGLNFMRFHSYCPPEAAFTAADEEGIYLQVECGMWNSFEPGDPMLEVAKMEADRILRTFGNHPSFVMLSPSNEPMGEWLGPLTEFVAYCKSIDSRKLYTIQSGWPFPIEPDQVTGTDYLYFHRSGFGLEPGGTIRNSAGWKGSDYRESLKDVTLPVICHELGQWCSYPDFSIIDKFTGYLSPSNFEVFRGSAKAHGVEQYSKEFQYHSGKLQSLMYKEEIEANLRTPHLYGFELLDLHDYLGQGTALVGVLDAFWEEKGYINAKEWKRFCSKTVPLARIPKYVYEAGETVTASVEISHFGEAELYQATVSYELREGTVLLKKSILSKLDIPIGKNIEVGTINVTLPSNQNSVYELSVCIETQEGECFINSWKLWSYQNNHKKLKEFNECKESKEPCQVFYTKDWEAANEALKEGKKVLFNPKIDSLSYDCPKLQFKPVFWNAQMGPTWARGLGILCDPAHPVFRRFPTESYAQWQWEEILDGARGINLSCFGGELSPIVRVIDDWNRNYPIALMLEAKVENGSLFMTTVDFNLEAEEEKSLVTPTLLESILHYMESEEFSPTESILFEEMKAIYHDNHTMELLGVSAVLEEDKTKDIKVICNGNAEDYLLIKGHPAHISLEIPTTHTFYGICYVPRQNQREHEGDIKGYQVEYRKEGRWELLCEGELKSSFAPKSIIFPRIVTTDAIRFTVCSGFGGEHVTKWDLEKDGWHQTVGAYSDPYVSIACLTLLTNEWFGTWKGAVKDYIANVKSATTDIEN